MDSNLPSKPMETGALALTTKKSYENSTLMLTLMEEVRLGLMLPEMETDQIKAIREIWERLSTPHPFRRFREAVLLAVVRTKYWPKPSEIAEALDLITSKKAHEVSSGHEWQKKDYCHECGNNRWVVAFYKKVGVRQMLMPTYKRCPCVARRVEARQA